MPEDSDTSENVYKSLNLLKKKKKEKHCHGDNVSLASFYSSIVFQV